MSDPNGWPDHERIWLEPPDGADPDTGRCWCQHPAPGANDDRTWTEYVRADLVAAHSAAAAAEMREACVEFHLARQQRTLPPENAPIRGYLQPAWHKTSAELLAKLPLPAPDALARMLAAERRAGMEEAASMAERAAANALDTNGRMELLALAAAIRARMEAGNAG